MHGSESPRDIFLRADTQYSCNTSVLQHIGMFTAPLATPMQLNTASVPPMKNPGQAPDTNVLFVQRSVLCKNTEMGDRVWVQFPVPDIYFGM